jgi:hypothetical protein
VSASLAEWLVPQTPDGQNLTAVLVGERCVGLLWSRHGAHEVLVAPRQDSDVRVLSEQGANAAARWCVRTQGAYPWASEAGWQALWHIGTAAYGYSVFRWLFKHFERPVSNQPAPTDLLIGSPLRRGRSTLTLT